MNTYNPNTDNRYSLTGKEVLQTFSLGMGYGGLVNLEMLVMREAASLETILINGLYLAGAFGAISLVMQKNIPKAIHTAVVTYVGALLAQGIADFAFYTVQNLQ